MTSHTTEAGGLRSESERKESLCVAERIERMVSVSQWRAVATLALAIAAITSVAAAQEELENLGNGLFSDQAVSCTDEDGVAPRVKFKNGTELERFVLSNATLEMDILASEQLLETLFVCFQIVSVQFEPLKIWCLKQAEARLVVLNYLPYNEHLVLSWLQLGESGPPCKGSHAIRWMHVTPILPEKPYSRGFTPCSTEKRRTATANNAELINGGGLAIIILVNRGGQSFRDAAESWFKSGLLKYASQRIVYLQEWKHPEVLDSNRLYKVDHHSQAVDPRVATLPAEYNFEILGKNSQVFIGPAMNSLIEHVQQTAEHVLFLEEDFIVSHEPLIRPENVLKRIEQARHIVRSGRADVFQLRHRTFPGDPFPPFVWKGHEREILHIETPYISNHTFLSTIHWLHDPPIYFGDGHTLAPEMWHCEDRKTESCFCAYSTHAFWSNNPWLSTPIFFKQYIAPTILLDWTKRIDDAINGSPHLWDHQCFVIAKGQGLFTHRDVDGRPLVEQSPYEDPFTPDLTRRVERVKQLASLGNLEQEMC